jgi:hypothetical protein
MKGLIAILVSLFVLCGSSWAQVTKKDKSKKEKERLENLSPQAKHDAYIQKANNQKLLGWFAMGLGTSVVLGGTAKMMSDAFKGSSKTDIKLLWLPTAGLLTGIGSYFIIKDSKNKKKKAALILEQESAQIGHPQHIPNFSFPTIGISIAIR